MATKPRSQDYEAGGGRTLQNYRPIFHNDLLRGKVALVTGGGSGIGFTIAELLMRHGCDIAIASRNIQKLQAAKIALEKAAPGRKCHVVQMDVRKPNQVDHCVNEVLSTYNHIDILVNNSAGNFLCLAESLSPNAFKTVMDIDTNGTFNVSKASFEKYFKKHGGVIVNISATLHVNGQVMQSHAGCAKAAIEALTKHLAVEWGPSNVRVVSVSPGPIGDTEGYERLGGKVVSEADIASNIPIGRIGKRLDIAQMVLFLASDAGSFITGTTIVADGGHVLTAPNGLASVARLMGASKL